MSVLLDSSTRVLAVSATGPYGQAQIEFMRRSGTTVVGGVSPGRGGTEVDGLAYFDTVAEAAAVTGATAAAVYTPAPGCAAAIMECADAGLKLVFGAAEHVPLHDSLYALPYARERGAWVVGPNSVGMASPGKAALGAIPAEFTRRGSLGLIGRSGTLTMTIARLMSSRGIGQSTIAHVGGDTLTGRNPHEWLRLFLDDPETSAIAYFGELGGSKEYAMLDLVASASKPVYCFVAGRHAPSGKRMGHAGALAGAVRETAAAKADALAEAGARVARTPYRLVDMMIESGLAA